MENENRNLRLTIFPLCDIMYMYFFYIPTFIKSDLLRFFLFFITRIRDIYVLYVSARMIKKMYIFALSVVR